MYTVQERPCQQGQNWGNNAQIWANNNHTKVFKTCRSELDNLKNKPKTDQHQ